MLPSRDVYRPALERDIGEKAKQNSARNNAECSKCFQFSLIIAMEHGFSMHQHSPGPFGGVGTWRMSVHEKPCLIPILLCTNVILRDNQLHSSWDRAVCYNPSSVCAIMS